MYIVYTYIISSAYHSVGINNTFKLHNYDMNATVKNSTNYQNL